MIAKSKVIKCQEGVYLFPLQKNSSMKVPATLFLTEKLLSQLSVETDIETQIINACSLEGVEKVVITPDTHLGYGVPIGSVISSPTHLYPTAAGYDISCSVSLFKTTLKIEDVKDKVIRRKFIEKIELCVPLGVGKHRVENQKTLDRKTQMDCLVDGLLPLTKKIEHFERSVLEVDFKFLDDIPVKSMSAIDELGSLGGGNHFLEMQADQLGQIYIMIHTGSRGFGWNIADYFFKMAKELKCHKDLLAFPFDSALGKKYWNLHNMAGNFALVNHYLISEALKLALLKLFPSLQCEDVYTISHNLIQKEFDHFIHRKGATRAFPAKLCQGTMWEKTGHPIIIPGSMYEGAAVLYAKDEAQESLYSINHGAGRALGRKQALRTLNQKEVNSSMNDIIQEIAGVKVPSILINTRNVPLDESRFCYKRLDDILEAVEIANLAKVDLRLYPLATIKGE